MNSGGNKSNLCIPWYRRRKASRAVWPMCLQTPGPRRQNFKTTVWTKPCFLSWTPGWEHYITWLRVSEPVRGRGGTGTRIVFFPSLPANAASTWQWPMWVDTLCSQTARAQGMDPAHGLLGFGFLFWNVGMNTGIYFIDDWLWLKEMTYAVYPGQFLAISSAWEVPVVMVVMTQGCVKGSNTGHRWDSWSSH